MADAFMAALGASADGDLLSAAGSLETSLQAARTDPAALEVQRAAAAARAEAAAAAQPEPVHLYVACMKPRNFTTYDAASLAAIPAEDQERMRRMACSVESGIEGYGVVISDTFVPPQPGCSGEASVYLWDEARSYSSDPSSGHVHLSLKRQSSVQAVSELLCVLLCHLRRIVVKCIDQKLQLPSLIIHFARDPLLDDEETKMAMGMLINMVCTPLDQRNAMGMPTARGKLEPEAKQGDRKKPFLPYIRSVSLGFIHDDAQQADEDSQFGPSPALAMLDAIDEAEASPTELMMFASQRTGRDGLYTQHPRTKDLANSLIVCVVKEQEIVPFFNACRWASDAQSQMLLLSAAGSEFAEGDSVRIHGLQSAVAAQWNGEIGLVTGFLKARGRYAIQMPGAAKPLAVKPGNLTAVDSDSHGT